MDSSFSSRDRPTPIIAERTASSTASSPSPQAAGAYRQRHQAVYLGGELRLDLRAEPPYL